MPSIQDVADQINAKLDEINQHTAATVSRLHTLDADLDAGLGNLADGLLAIWELQKVANAVLEHQSDQNDTIICLLTNANELLCGMTRKLTLQLELSEQVAHLAPAYGGHRGARPRPGGRGLRPPGRARGQAARVLPTRGGAGGAMPGAVPRAEGQPL